MKFSPDFWKLVEDEVALGNITKTKHPDYDIFILCYGKTVQYSRNWNEATMNCRGLVIDKDYNVLHYPMKKFFNDFEHSALNIQIPALPFKVYEKLDGSLINVFPYEGKWLFSSKASFISYQKVLAEELFHELFGNPADVLDEAYNYVFELIHPDNKIVVDYKDRKDLVLLSVYDREGNDIDIDNFYRFSKPKIYDGLKDHSKIKEMFNHYKGTEFEGFVIKFENGFRMKIKLDDYLNLHKAISNLSLLSVWENVDCKTLKVKEEFVSSLPEEFRESVDFLKNQIENVLDKEWKRLSELGEKCPKEFSSPKERYLYLAKNFPLDTASVLNYITGQHDRLKEWVWKKCRPTGNKK